MCSAISQYAGRIIASFAVIYAALGYPATARRAVMAILFMQTALLAYSANVHSPTLNEPGHLAAGLSNWRFGQFDAYSVNPPLVRMVAALPVLAVGCEEDWGSFHSGVGVRPEFDMGNDFVAANRERSIFLFRIARYACIPFSWVGAMVCYLWARDLYGRPAGVMACLLWCIEPNILGHSSLITPDAHAASLGIAACYTFWIWLRHPTWSRAILTGVVLGLAELSKTTLLILYPLWPLLWVMYRWSKRNEMLARDWFREGGMLILRIAIGIYVVNFGYGFEGSFKPLREFHFVSNLLTARGDRPIPPKVEMRSEDITYPLGNSVQLPHSDNRFAESRLGLIPVPFPKNYLVGIDFQQRDFESYGRPSYLLGNWSDQGWWYYYCCAIAFKVPLGILLLGGMTLWIRCRRGWLGNQTVQLRDELVLLAPALIVLVVVSSKSGFSEHMRYVLPAFPFVFVWVSQLLTLLNNSRKASCNSSSRSEEAYRISPHHPCLVLLPIVFLIWATGSSLFVFPHSLSYFNESTGGPSGGGKFLLSSNVDWGQDLYLLDAWMKRNGRTSSIAVAYYGLYNPRDLGLFRIAAIESPAGSGKASRPPVLQPGLYAISVNFVNGYPSSLQDSRAKPDKFRPNDLIAFSTRKPKCTVGYSLHIYELTTHFHLGPKQSAP